MQIGTYLEQLRSKYASGQATEHSYRPALQALFEAIDPALTVINEPKKSEAGMPDFLFERGGVPIGWAEAKDIDKDVIKLKGYSIEQRKRYEKAYPNLIYTNGVDFEFIRDGAPVLRDAGAGVGRSRARLRPTDARSAKMAPGLPLPGVSTGHTADIVVSRLNRRLARLGHR